MAPQSICSPDEARLLSRLYFLANPARPHQDLRRFVEHHSACLQAGSPVIRCAARLGRALERRGMAALDPDDCGSILDPGYATAEQARCVVLSIQRGAVDPGALGRELSWLSRVIPPAARGDWRPYDSTGTPLRRMLAPAKHGGEWIRDMAERGAQPEVASLFQPLMQGNVEVLACLIVESPPRARRGERL